MNNLSSQEQKVLELVAQGHQNEVIADRLCLSSHTIKNHKANLKKKLGFASCTQLYQYAIQLLANPDEESAGGVIC